MSNISDNLNNNRQNGVFPVPTDSNSFRVKSTIEKKTDTQVTEKLSNNNNHVTTTTQKVVKPILVNLNNKSNSDSEVSSETEISEDKNRLPENKKRKTIALSVKNAKSLKTDFNQSPINASLLNSSQKKTFNLQFEGEWRNRKPWNGKGEQTNSKNGSFFKGEWQEGNRWNGTGKLIHSDGSSFEGEIQNGKVCNGKGKRIYPDGTSFEGEWKEGIKWNGTGTIINPKGHLIECEWKEGKFEAVAPAEEKKM
jgi:hypothetical protein